MPVPAPFLPMSLYASLKVCLARSRCPPWFFLLFISATDHIDNKLFERIGSMAHSAICS